MSLAILFEISMLVTSVTVVTFYSCRGLSHCRFRALDPSTRPRTWAIVNGFVMGIVIFYYLRFRSGAL